MVGFAEIGLITGGIESLFQMFGGNEAQKAYDYNAVIAENEANLIRQGAKLDEYRKRKQLKSFVGRQTAGYASSGVEFTGSPIDVIQDTVANAELEIAINQFNLETQARGKESEAGRLREAGKAEKTASYIKAGTTLLASAGNYASKYYNPLKKSKPTSQVYKGGAVKSGDYSPFSFN